MSRSELPSARSLRGLADHATAPLKPAWQATEVAERAAFCLLDLFGCFLAANRLGANAPLRGVVEALGGPPEATLWGSRDRAPAAHAALLAGTVAHHLDFDGGWHGRPGAGVHPAVTILPGALAVAEQTNATGRDVVVATAVGYDVLTALATQLSPGIAARRLHPPGLLGAFGATAAAGRLRGLAPERMAGALAWCAGVVPLAPFEAFSAGASAKDFYGGWPNLVGIILAGREPPTGGHFTLARLFRRPDQEPGPELDPPDRPALLDADFKPYPTCRSTQPALTALEDLLDERPIDPDAVAEIRVETYPYAVELDEAAAELTPIGARTSVGVCLALRLVYGPLGAEHFTADRLADPRVRRLAEATSVTVGEPYARPVVRGATIVLHLIDGSSRSRAADAVKWSPQRPAAPDDLRAKFRALAEPTLGASRARELEVRTLALADLPSVTPLLELLVPAQPTWSTDPIAAAGSRPDGSDTAALLETVRGRLGPCLAARGADPRVAEVATGTVTAASARGLDAAGQHRALTLSLCLAPVGGGPIPDDWSALVSAWAVRLAGAGFSGPAGVLDGPRGLLHLCAEE